MRNTLTRLLTLTFAVSLAFLSACTGYEDGPSINLRDSDKKLIRPWRVTQSAVAGATSTQFLGDTWTFQEDGGFSILDVDFSVTIAPGQTLTGPKQGRGEWTFVEKPAGLEIFYSLEYTDPFNASVTYRDERQDVWQILRFTQKELWLQRGDLVLELSAL